MRTFAIGLVAAAALACVLAPDAQARGWSFEEYVEQKAKSDWEGFGVGTTIHVRTTNEVTMPGMPTPQKQVTEQKKTLVEITDTEYVIKVETLTAGQWIESEERQPKDEGLTSVVEDVGSEVVSVGGTDYPCTKKQVTWKKGEEIDEEATLWVHPEAGILRMALGGDMQGTMTVTRLSFSHTVAGHAVTARELDMEMRTPQGMTLTGKAVMSLDVPNGLVLNEMSGKQGPVEVEVEVELIGFVRK